MCRREACFSENIRLSSGALPLSGTAELRHYFFHVYTAALYVPLSATTPSQALEDVPKALVIHYHRAIDAKDIVEASEDLLRRGSESELAALRAEVSLLHSAYRNVQAGDRYALQYEPPKGTTLLRNDVPVITIPGRQFARIYFGIWLSDVTAPSAFVRALFDGRRRS